MKKIPIYLNSKTGEITTVGTKEEIEKALLKTIEDGTLCSTCNGKVGFGFCSKHSTSGVTYLSHPLTRK